MKSIIKLQDVLFLNLLVILILSLYWDIVWFEPSVYSIGGSSITLKLKLEFRVSFLKPITLISKLTLYSTPRLSSTYV